MKYVITAAVAALALFATAGTASAQHGNSRGGHYGHHIAPTHHPVAPAHHGGHLSLGHSGYPAVGFGVGVSPGPVYGGGIGGYSTPVYGQALAPAHGYRHVPHHRSHH